MPPTATLARSTPPYCEATRHHTAFMVNGVRHAFASLHTMDMPNWAHEAHLPRSCRWTKLSTPISPRRLTAHPRIVASPFVSGLVSPCTLHGAYNVWTGERFNVHTMGSKVQLGLSREKVTPCDPPYEDNVRDHGWTDWRYLGGVAACVPTTVQ